MRTCLRAAAFACGIGLFIGACGCSTSGLATPGFSDDFSAVQASGRPPSLPDASGVIFYIDLLWDGHGPGRA